MADLRGVRCVLLDRDGVVNRRLERGVLSPGDLEMLPAALAGIRMLRQAGALIAVVSNQANVGRGLLSREALRDIHAAMLREVRGCGGDIDAVYVCEHIPAAGCECRKPQPGLLLRAMRDLGAGPDTTVMVGDDATDIEAARRAGCRAVYVGGGSARALQDGTARSPLHASDLQEAARWMVQAMCQSRDVPQAVPA